LKPSHEVRRAGVDDAEAVGRMLHDFNSEYDDYTPGPEAMGKRIAGLLESGDVTVLIGGDGPDGLALLRFRPSLWSESLDCYLEELYVVPDLRGRGLGRALMEAAIETARAEGAGYMDLGTAETDTAARALYEKMGFSRTEGKPDGPVNYFYERELQ
jgi:ribosomal protein S18 acetylase RimI-like enzyme